MKKEEIKQILFSLRTSENEAAVNFLAGSVDMMNEKEIEKILMQIGNNADAVKKLFEDKIAERTRRENRGNEAHKPINKLFTYGLTDKTAHLHMPVQLENIKGKGITGKFNTANLYMLDAIDRIVRMQDAGDPRFKNVKNIYMISPILVSRELEELKSLGFDTALYSKRDIANPIYCATNPEARLAKEIFGDKSNVGTAKISLKKVRSKEWQELKAKKMQEYEEKGVTLEVGEEK